MHICVRLIFLLALIFAGLKTPPVMAQTEQWSDDYPSARAFCHIYYSRTGLYVKGLHIVGAAGQPSRDVIDATYQMPVTGPLQMSAELKFTRDGKGDFKENYENTEVRYITYNYFDGRNVPSKRRISSNAHRLEFSSPGGNSQPLEFEIRYGKRGFDMPRLISHFGTGAEVEYRFGPARGWKSKHVKGMLRLPDERTFGNLLTNYGRLTDTIKDAKDPRCDTAEADRNAESEISTIKISCKAYLWWNEPKRDTIIENKRGRITWEQDIYSKLDGPSGIELQFNFDSDWIFSSANARQETILQGALTSLKIERPYKIFRDVKRKLFMEIRAGTVLQRLPMGYGFPSRSYKNDRELFLTAAELRPFLNQKTDIHFILYDGNSKVQYRYILPKEKIRLAASKIGEMYSQISNSNWLTGKQCTAKESSTYRTAPVEILAEG